jgi:serine protease AprX
MRKRTRSQLIKNRSLFIILFLLIFTLSQLPAQENVQFESFILQGKDTGQLVKLVTSHGGIITSRLESVHGVGALLPKTAIHKLSQDASVTKITPNARVRTTGKGGNPPIPNTEYPEAIGADYTWSQGEVGAGITVAVVDTGIARHQGIFQDLDGKQNERVIGWVDIVDGKPSPHDPNGHGTHIAGIISNSQTNQDGEISGISPGIELVGVRVLDQNGFGTYEQVIQGIEWVIEHKDEFNIRVMNLSLISQVLSPYWADPLNQVVMQAWAQGITVVAAAGNDGPGPMSIGVPGNNPYIITAGAFTDNFTPDDWNDDYLTPFSAAGPTLDGFVKPDLVAPGAHIASTMLPSSYISRNHEANRLSAQYFSMAGTSQAAAVVSGVAALTIAHQPDLTPDQVKYRLMISAFPWVDTQSTEALYSIWQQGAGRVSAPDAVFGDYQGSANFGMDIQADIDGEKHFEGFSYFDENSGEFRLRGDFADWAGGYGNWAGGYGNWAGGYGNWAGGYGNWAGGYGNWAGGYGNWAGGYGNWAGGYGNWAGGYGNWAGGYGNWAGGYGNWAGGYGNWAGGYGNWAGAYGDLNFAEAFTNWSETTNQRTPTNLSGSIWVDFGN